MKIQGKLIRVTKLKDTAFNGEHPNGIYEGSERNGISYMDLQVGGCLVLLSGFYTSTVTEIDENNMTFKTLNSIYKLEIIEDVKNI